LEKQEVKTEDAVYLVKVSSKLHYTMAKFGTDEFQVNDLGNVVTNNDLKFDIYPDEEE